MQSLIRLLSAVAISSLFAIPDVHGEERTMDRLQITSPVFAQNGTIPSKFTCDGADVSPPLSVVNVPEKARSLALIVDDPDAPAGTWVHWVVWNILPGTKEIPENWVPGGAVQGRNDFGGARGRRAASDRQHHLHRAGRVPRRGDGVRHEGLSGAGIDLLEAVALATGFGDVKAGDVLEVYELEEIRPSLD